MVFDAFYKSFICVNSCYVIYVKCEALQSNALWVLTGDTDIWNFKFK